MKELLNRPAGDSVICDSCGEDWTDRTETGGFLFVSKAYCPVCAEQSLPVIKQYHEEHFIRAWCPADISFADWVRRLRFSSGGDRTVIYVSE